MEFPGDVPLVSDVMQRLPRGPEPADLSRQIGLPQQLNDVPSGCLSACAGGIKADNCIADEGLVGTNAREMPVPLGLTFRWRDFKYRPLFDDVNDGRGAGGVLHKAVSITGDKGSPSAHLATDSRDVDCPEG